jgi:uncharacterized membrane protein
MEAYLLDWLNLLLRWLHLIVAIAWIGASFYFIWLDNHLEAPAREEDVMRGVGGELWAVHGGGFYRAEKFRARPPALPERLHWFKWEAYWTWFSGFALLVLIYYVGAELNLVDRSVADISRATAIGIGLATLLGGWLIYDALCKSPMARNDRALSVVLFLLLCLAAWGLTQVFSGRGAYMHFGALLGTIMVANVAMVIIPGHKAMVEAAAAGRDPDPRFGAAGKQRSVHNTYFTLPVVFIMVSGHYAFTYGHRYNWILLILLLAAGALIRVWFVDRHRGAQAWTTLVLAAALLGAVAWIALPRGASTQVVDDWGRVRDVVAKRCASCHSAQPTQPGIMVAPKGIVLETEAQSRAAAALIVQQSVATRVMPPGNITAMTEEERALLGAWAATVTRDPSR